MAFQHHDIQFAEKSELRLEANHSLCIEPTLSYDGAIVVKMQLSKSFASRDIDSPRARGIIHYTEFLEGLMHSRFFAAAALMFSLATPALSADAPAPVSYDPIPSALYNWSGFYVGVNAGYAWGDADVSAFGFTDSGDYDGWLGGIQAGVNWQADAWVLGIEADIQATGIDYSETVPGIGTASSDLDWLGTVRGRVGYAMDRFLPYVTGGLAFGSNEISGTIVGLGSASEDNTHVGWTLGAGLEAAITDNMSAKLEYLHVDLGDETYFGALNADADFEIVRVGLNYRLPY